MSALHGEQCQDQGLGVLRRHIPRRQPGFFPYHLLRVRAASWKNNSRYFEAFYMCRYNWQHIATEIVRMLLSTKSNCFHIMGLLGGSTKSCSS